jgi:hypothetical protein
LACKGKSFAILLLIYIFVREMNSLNLNALSVQEMNTAEMWATEGGIGLLPYVLGGLLTGFLYDVFSDPKASASAFRDGLNGRYY